jgi:hypothetical protein
MQKSWKNDINALKKALSLKMCKQIKTWRVGEGPHDMNTYSWRAIATAFVEKNPEFSKNNNIISSNQISGMMLCESAMLKLKETLENGWN